MEAIKKSNIIPVSFKNNVQDQILLCWTYEQGELVGNSAYIKTLIKEDMDRKTRGTEKALDN